MKTARRYRRRRGGTRNRSSRNNNSWGNNNSWSNNQNNRRLTQTNTNKTNNNNNSSGEIPSPSVLKKLPPRVSTRSIIPQNVIKRIPPLPYKIKTAVISPQPQGSVAIRTNNRISPVLFPTQERVRRSALLPGSLPSITPPSE
jgi:hypothetical protein